MQTIISFIKNHLLLNLTWCILLIIIIYNFIQEKLYKINEINNYELIELMNKKKIFIIDLRNNKDYCNGHILNSINIDLNKSKNKNIYKNFKNKNNPIILTCKNGNLSKKWLNFFYNLGCKNVYILQGGINYWNKKNLPLVYVKKKEKIK